MLVAAIAPYAGTITGGFVYDDRYMVLGNPWIQSLENLPSFFTSTRAWGLGADEPSYYRPLMHVVYAFTYRVVELAPWGYHAVNVALHGVVSALVYLLVRRLLELGGVGVGGALPGAFAAGLLFATHAIHSEVVAWVSCATELLLALFWCLASLCHLGARRWQSFAGAACLMLALLSKETAAALLPLLVVLDLALGRMPAGWTARVARYAPYASALALYAVLRLGVASGVAPFQRHADLGGLDVAVNTLPLFAQYLGKLILPTALSPFHPFHPLHSLASARGLIGLGATLLFVSASLFAWRRSRLAGCALAAIAFPLLPALYLPALGESVFAERYLYLPSIGLSLLAGLGIAWLGSRSNAAARVGLGIAVVAALLHAGGAFARGRVWSDELRLWIDTVEKAPLEPAVHANLADAYLRAGRIEAALAHRQRAIQLNPESVRLRLSLANDLSDLGDHTSAMQHYRAAVGIDPGSADAQMHLGVALGRSGRLDAALEHLRRAAAIAPQDEIVQHNLQLAERLAGQAPPR